MIPEFCRPFETSTLMDLVSYGQPADEEPHGEEPSSDEVESPSQRGATTPRRR